MAWLQIIVECPAAQADELSDLLAEGGAAAVTLLDDADQPLYEPPPGATPLWERTRVQGLFPADVDAAAVMAEVAARRGGEPPRWRAEALEDKNWSREWMDSFQPMRFGERLWIVPSWHAPPDPDGVNLLLDPGLAFGTGTHPTTRLCLQFLDAAPLPGVRVIDYGCGSGILAIAAARLGATEVWGVDNDPQALTATVENARRNAVEERIHTVAPEALAALAADVLVANILARPLIELAPRLAERVRPGGLLALSGVLAEQAEEVAAAYRPWFEVSEPRRDEDWVRLDGVRR